MEEMLEYQLKLKKLKTEELLDELIKYSYWKEKVFLIKLEVISRTKK